MTPSAENVRRLLRPRSVAFVGGSLAPNALAECEAAGFDGPIYAVHPTRAEVGGHATYPSVLDLPAPPDAAFVAVERRREHRGRPAACRARRRRRRSLRGGLLRGGHGRRRCARGGAARGGRRPGRPRPELLRRRRPRRGRQPLARPVPARAAGPRGRRGAAERQPRHQRVDEPALAAARVSRQRRQPGRARRRAGRRGLPRHGRGHGHRHLPRRAARCRPLRPDRGSCPRPRHPHRGLQGRLVRARGRARLHPHGVAGRSRRALRRAVRALRRRALPVDSRAARDAQGAHDARARSVAGASSSSPARARSARSPPTRPPRAGSSCRSPARPLARPSESCCRSIALVSNPLDYGNALWGQEEPSRASSRRRSAIRSTRRCS